MRVYDQNLIKSEKHWPFACTESGLRTWAGEGALDRKNPSVAAFTLVELLAIMAIIVLMTALVAPVMTSLKGGNDFTTAVYDMAGVLEQSRAYAMAENTHVFVGITEVDASRDELAPNQTPASVNAGGRVAIAVMASKDGTSHFDPTNKSVWINSLSSTPIPFALMGKIRRIENMHLMDISNNIPASGGMVRPLVTAGCNVANDSSDTPFSLPLASQTQSAQYVFNRVIAFDSRGTASYVTAANENSVPKVIEIAMQPTHGNKVPPIPEDQNKGNHAAIQIEGLTGAIQIFRP